MIFLKKTQGFEGKDLIDSEEVPKVNFLSGDFGKDVLEEYAEIVKKDYMDGSPSDVLPYSALNVLSYNNNLARVSGSNPFAIVLINQVIKKERLRTANQADLEKILKTKVLDLSGTYEDSALILRSEWEPNYYLAKNLMKQVKQRGKDSKIKMPVMIPLYDLELIKDFESPYGLSFKLKENAGIIYASVLNNKDNRFLSQNIDKETGLPGKFSKEGNRILHNGRSGLSLLRLGKFLNLYSESKFFDHSSNEGRIIVVKEK